MMQKRSKDKPPQTSLNPPRTTTHDIHVLRYQLGKVKRRLQLAKIAASDWSISTSVWCSPV